MSEFKAIVLRRRSKERVPEINRDSLIHQIYDILFILSQKFTEKYNEIIDPKKFALAKQIIFEKSGFILDRKTSELAASSTGVFVTKGRIVKHSIVAFYPGTVYRPGESAFLQSIINKFVFRCFDGTLIDGNDSGLSKLVFRSCTLRDRAWPYLVNDMTWMTPNPANPLAVGQYVNKADSESDANVFYEEVDFPVDLLKMHERRFLPNLLYAKFGNFDLIRMVVLISMKDIEINEELKSYFLR